MLGVHAFDVERFSLLHRVTVPRNKTKTGPRQANPHTEAANVRMAQLLPAQSIDKTW